MFYPKSKMGQRLSAAEEAKLALLAQKKGDVCARNRLILANLGLVYFVVNQMFRPFLQREDLLQEGLLGLIRACETFEPDRQIRFSTYGVFWVRARIQQFIRAQEKERVWQVSGFSVESLSDDTQNPETWMLRKERIDQTRRVFNRLMREFQNPKLRVLIQYRI